MGFVNGEHIFFISSLKIQRLQHLFGPTIGCCNCILDIKTIRITNLLCLVRFFFESNCKNYLETKHSYNLAQNYFPLNGEA